MKVTGVLLAAGRGERMGLDKLLLPFMGKSLMQHSLEALLESRLVGEVVVVVKPGFDAPKLTVPDRSKRLAIVENEHHAQGMGSSLRAGIEASREGTDAFVLSLADMPRVSGTLIDRLVEAWRHSRRPIVAPVLGGRRGHPVVVSASLRARLLECRQDEGLRSLIKENPSMVEEVEVDDPGCLFDVDRPEDLARGRRILIKGAGEHASGTAHRLFRCGYSVVMTEIEKPTAVRRTVSFCSAIFDGEAVVDGVAARRIEMSEIGSDGQRLDLLARTHVPVLVDEKAVVRKLWAPDVVIDARILKKNLDNSLDDAPLVIGYGPGLRAGTDVHVVVETMRGHDLGRIILDGQAAANTGVPGPIAGESKRRLLNAPVDGALKAYREIGDRVALGETICSVESVEVLSSIAGVLRGLVFPGSIVRRGQKIGDVDPRGDPGYCRTISEKARCISGAALEIIVSDACGRLHAEHGDVLD